MSYAPLVLVSALTGKGVVKILDLAEKVHLNASRKIGTHRLNDFLAWVTVSHLPLGKNKKRVKIKYMTQKGILPPTFVLFTHSCLSLAPSSEKYFVQCLRERFNYWGTPIRLFLRKG